MTRPATARRTVAGGIPPQVRRPAPASTTSRVHVQTRGSVDPRDVGYARYKVNAAMEHVRAPILLARVRLTELRDPSLARPSLAQANLDLDGVQVRAQVAAATMHEAVDALEDRLMRRLDRAAQGWQAQRGSRPREGEWRHETPPSAHPPYFPRPAEDRQVVRRKAFAVARETVEEAAFDMELLDYGFHLFTEEGTGVDSVLYRAGTELRLAQLAPRPELVTPGEVVVRMSPGPARTLALDDAISHLEQMGTPFVFFRDPRTGRGSVLYHRYDGHYGLIVPAA